MQFKAKGLKVVSLRFVTEIDYPSPRGIDRFYPPQETQKTKIYFFDSIDEISWTNTPRHPRHDQNMLETCFGPFKYDFRMVFEILFSRFLGFRGGGGRCRGRSTPPGGGRVDYHGYEPGWERWGVDRPPPRGGGRLSRLRTGGKKNSVLNFFFRGKICWEMSMSSQVMILTVDVLWGWN